MAEKIIRQHTVPDPEDKRKTISVYEHVVEIVDKPEEERVIFIIAGPPAFEGGPSLNMTAQEENIAALKEKQRWEQETGQEIFQFHRDPMAGGMRPVRPVTEQLWRTNPAGADGKPMPMRKEVFAATPKGMISLGKVGDVIEDENKQPVINRSNIKAGQNTMVATPAWVGLYIGSRVVE